MFLGVLVMSSPNPVLQKKTSLVLVYMPRFGQERIGECRAQVEVVPCSEESFGDESVRL